MPNVKKEIVKNHEILNLVGEKIKKIVVERITDERGDTVEVIRFDHTHGTHWLVPESFGTRRKKNNSFTVMVHEQYAENFESDPE